MTLPLLDLPVSTRGLRFTVGATTLEARLAKPAQPRGLVIVPRATGEATHVATDSIVAKGIHDAGFATLAVDLLTRPEAERDCELGTRHLDIWGLAHRLVRMTKLALESRPTFGLPTAFFATDVAGAVALAAGARLRKTVSSIVCRGARADLVTDDLTRITARTLLIVGEHDVAHLPSNRRAMADLPRNSLVAKLAGGHHLLDSPAEVAHVIELATAWLDLTLGGAAAGEQSLAS